MARKKVSLLERTRLAHARANLGEDASRAHVDGESHTALTEKAWSPFVMRKVTTFGFPIYVALITDDNLNDLDKTIHAAVHEKIAWWKNNNLQDKRNLAGYLSEVLCHHYKRVEGCAVILFIDKSVISSLFGDFMNHGMCRSELYSLLLMSTAV